MFNLSNKNKLIHSALFLFIFLFVFLFVFLLTFSYFLYTQKDDNYIFASTPQYVELEIINDQTFLPLYVMFRNLNYNFELDLLTKKIKFPPNNIDNIKNNITNNIFIYIKTNQITEISINTKSATKNDFEIDLSDQIIYINSNIYISESALELLFDLEILANVDTNTIYTFKQYNFVPIYNVYADIPEYVINQMLDISLPNVEEAKKLSMLEVTYIDFNDNKKLGSIIIKKELAVELCDIFKKLYVAKFPINSILLVDNYDGDDTRSMQSNNTSAFNYRFINGTRKLSNHSYGTAIDINPLVNPHVINNVAYPIEGQIYADRTIDIKGSINHDDYIYKLFKQYGWEWGGTWQNPDYQHFEKN